MVAAEVVIGGQLLQPAVFMQELLTLTWPQDAGAVHSTQKNAI
jgi:hypothetical protein